MKWIWLVLLMVVLQFSVACQTSDQRICDQYSSSYENQTLDGSLFPLPMPFNRWVDPAGEQLYYGDPKRENHALDCALSPDGKWLAVEGRYALVIVSPEENKIVFNLPLKHSIGKENPMGTFSGIQWRQQGDRYEMYWSVATSSRKSYVVQAGWNGRKAWIEKTFEFAAKPPAKTALPNEVWVAEEGGTPVLYVVLNGNNTVEKRDIASGKTIWSSPTGVAPYGIAAANGKLYVSNWAGSVPDKSDPNVAGVPWGSAKVDAETGATREGTVSVLDPETGNLQKEITVGLHPNDIVASPDGRFVYVANANSDTVSVIDTKTDAVSETIPIRLALDRNAYFGDSPNGLGLSGNGQTLYVAAGMDNAVAVVHLGAQACSSLSSGPSRVVGFIPTGAYPGGVCVYKDRRLFVPNIEAEGARIPSVSKDGKTVSYNSHQMKASISAIPVPDQSQLAGYTKQVEELNQIFRLALAEKLPRTDAAPVPVPARIGEPSVFKHVVYVIKENRTYDQILGDVEAGDGDPDLCVFGKAVTPNSHKLVEEFVLLDNFYVAGKCSAEGHQWTDSAIVTDYIEKNVRAWFRSYPHVQTDALVYAPTGFIWDNALRHGKSVRIYGEACTPKFDKKLKWKPIYNAFQRGEKLVFENHSTIATVRGILSPNYPGYDSHNIPDVLRASAFIDELNGYEKMEGDQWPQLVILALPNDHTGGTRPTLPTPRAMVADNDLALGQIVEAISKSKFWDSTAIFVTEDDSQAGWDHVSAYRTVGMVISPYSRLKQTNHVNCNQLSMICTMERMLGLPPMNIQDATARPMFECFSNTADRTHYAAVPNEIPLDEMNKNLAQLTGKALHYAKKSLEPQFDGIDSGNDELFNRILWFALADKKPYPAQFCGKDDDD
ncbi:bifunctional YncE family protein/alkaline phosphatase family protein [Pontiella sulfatireligans]|uniref:PE-PGRS family protein PE_PGRS18 n=1 Tax=Pontiella sulfatireligans TaxID=2750658 RepID=A0A6C2UQB1_9BACT|nr:YncE family protein [Pontiella sulfatireligans]VGO21461.1 PE-PGRS family protein PE_PGRS18 [Pontiella sulfatireligans]